RQCGWAKPDSRSFRRHRSLARMVRTADWSLPATPSSSASAATDSTHISRKVSIASMPVRPVAHSLAWAGWWTSNATSSSTRPGAMGARFLGVSAPTSAIPRRRACALSRRIWSRPWGVLEAQPTTSTVALLMGSVLFEPRGDRADRGLQGAAHRLRGVPGGEHRAERARHVVRRREGNLGAGRTFHDDVPNPGHGQRLRQTVQAGEHATALGHDLVHAGVEHVLGGEFGALPGG